MVQRNKSTKQTIPAVLNEYLNNLKVQIKPSSYSTYEGYLRKHITPYFKGLTCEDISPDLMQSFADKHINSGLSAKTVDTVLIFLKKGLGSMFPRGITVSLPRYSTSEPEMLSREEQVALEMVAQANPADNLAIKLCLYTGIKLGELCGLKWRDIDFKTGLMHIRRTAQRIKADEGDDGSPKTTLAILAVNPSARRSIPLARPLLNMLKEQERSGEYVLGAKQGGIPESRTIQHRFKNLLEEAGIRPLPFHATRNTFAARALEKGFDLKSLSEVLGHSSVLVTLKRYGPLLELESSRHMDMEAIAKEGWG